MKEQNLKKVVDLIEELKKNNRRMSQSGDLPSTYNISFDSFSPFDDSESSEEREESEEFEIPPMLTRDGPGTRVLFGMRDIEDITKEQCDEIEKQLKSITSCSVSFSFNPHGIEVNKPFAEMILSVLQSKEAEENKFKITAFYCTPRKEAAKVVNQINCLIEFNKWLTEHRNRSLIEDNIKALYQKHKETQKKAFSKEIEFTDLDTGKTKKIAEENGIFQIIGDCLKSDYTSSYQMMQSIALEGDWNTQKSLLSVLAPFLKKLKLSRENITFPSFIELLLHNFFTRSSPKAQLSMILSFLKAPAPSSSSSDTSEIIALAHQNLSFFSDNGPPPQSDSGAESDHNTPPQSDSGAIDGPRVKRRKT